MLVKIFIHRFVFIYLTQYFLFVLFNRLLETYPDLLSDIITNTNDEQCHNYNRMLKFLFQIK